MSTESDRPGFDRKMTADEINELPIQRFTGKVHLIRNASDCRRAVRALKREKVLGFDTETRPAFKKGESYPVSLIQIADSHAVYIFQISLFGLTRDLRALLANKRVIKAGAGLSYDFVKLRELKPFEPAGVFDVGERADELGIKNHGLRGMTAVLLGYRISKQSQRSNWSRPNLSEAQINYAAMDAWVSRELYLALKKFKPAE